MAEKQEPDHEPSSQEDSSSQESLHSAQATPSASGAEPWWDLPIANRNIAAYQAGRLLNQFCWNADQAWFGNASLLDIVDEIFNQFTAVSYEFVIGEENILEPEVRNARALWERNRTCEEACEEFCERLAPEPDPTVYDPFLSLEDHYWWLMKVWVEPVVDRLNGAFREQLDSGERWLFKLGVCVDEGVRPRDFHKFIHGPTPFTAPEAIAAEPDPEVEDAECGSFGCRREELRVPNYRPKPGELEADKDWHVRLSKTWKKAGLSGTLPSQLVNPSSRSTCDERLAIVAEIDKFVRKKLARKKLVASVAKKPWFHGEDEAPPNGFSGPLRAQKQQLAKALMGGKGDPRTFENACRLGKFWVKKLERGRYEAWCKLEDGYKKGRNKLKDLFDVVDGDDARPNQSDTPPKQ